MGLRVSFAMQKSCVPYDGCGSFALFSPSRRVRFAPRADVRRVQARLPQRAFGLKGKASSPQGQPRGPPGATSAATVEKSNCGDDADRLSFASEIPVYSMDAYSDGPAITSVRRTAREGRR
jgi:hypothetical protein